MKIKNLSRTIVKGTMHLSGIMVIVFYIGYLFFTDQGFIPLDSTIWYSPLVLTLILHSIFFTLLVILSFATYGGEFANKGKFRIYSIFGISFIIAQCISLILFILSHILNVIEFALLPSYLLFFIVPKEILYHRSP